MPGGISIVRIVCENDDKMDLGQNVISDRLENAHMIKIRIKELINEIDEKIQVAENKDIRENLLMRQKVLRGLDQYLDHRISILERTVIMKWDTI